jgi:hypothetical protein
MTAQKMPRYGFSLSLMVAALVAIAIAGSVWAKGEAIPMTSDSTRIDVAVIMVGVDVSNLPILEVEYPF